MEANNKQIVLGLADRLRSVIPFYGFSGNAIKLIFMKYLSQIDEAYSVADFKPLMAYKNMFINKIFDEQTVCDVFGLVEKNYGMENGLLVESVDKIKSIFGDKPDFIFGLLNDFELPKTNEEMISLLEIILDYGDNKDISRNGLSSTNSSLIKLVKGILDVKPNEIYMDAFTGFGKSMLEIDANSYLGYELNFEVASIVNMIMIMSGKKSFSIKNQNYYFVECYGVADKVFSDGPLNAFFTPDESNQLGNLSRKGDYYTLKKAVESLKPNGVAAVTCSGNVLLKSEFKSLREMLTFRNLKAVIALPPLWSGTTIPTNLVIFEKDRVGNDVIMVDASSSDNVVKDRRTNALTDEAIKNITNAINGEIIEDYSTVVSVDEILKDNGDTSWVPAHYIKKQMKIEYRASAEVEKDLNEVYKELQKILSK